MLEGIQLSSGNLSDVLDIPMEEWFLPICVTNDILKDWDCFKRLSFNMTADFKKDFPDLQPYESEYDI